MCICIDDNIKSSSVWVDGNCTVLFWWMSECMYILSEIKVTRNPTVSLHFPYTFYNEE